MNDIEVVATGFGNKPIVRFYGGGQPMLSFTLKTRCKIKGELVNNFWDVIYFGKDAAEIVFPEQGKITVRGGMQYQDEEWNGTSKRKYTIVAESIEGVQKGYPEGEEPFA